MENYKLDWGFGAFCGVVSLCMLSFFNSPETDNVNSIKQDTLSIKEKHLLDSLKIENLKGENQLLRNQLENNKVKK